MHTTTNQIFEATFPEQLEQCLQTGSTAPLFSNTDVPLACLFIHLEHGYTIQQFLKDFPSVSKEEIKTLLEWMITVFKAPNLLAQVIVDLSDREEE